MSWEKIEEFKTKMKELQNTQTKVDAALSKMSAGPAKDRLLKLKAESRGIFSDYIMPAWKKITDLIGNDAVAQTSTAKPTTALNLSPTTQTFVNNLLTTPVVKASPLKGYDLGYHEDGSLGILPLLPIAAVLAATAGVGYVAKAIYTEQKILNDPALTATQKTELLKSTGAASSLSSISEITGNASKILFLGAGLYALIKVLPMLKKRA
jgi:hypothetical protein